MTATPAPQSNQLSVYQQKVKDYLRQALIARGVDPETAERQSSGEAQNAPKQSGMGSLGQAGASAATLAATVYAKQALAKYLAGKGVAAGSTTITTPSTLGGYSSLGSSTGATAGTSGAGTSAGTSTGGLGLSAGTAAGLGAVAAYYGPSYYKYGKELAGGDVDSDSAIKGAMLTNPITAWAVPIADWAGLEVKSGKHKDQLLRDKVRDHLWKNKVINDKFELELPEGRSFNIGIDGSSRPYNVDLSRAGAGEAVGLASPLSSIFAPGSDKMQSDFAGYLANAVMSGGNAKANIRSIYDKAGLTQRQAYDVLNSQGLDPSLLAAKHHAINQAFGNGGFAADGTTNLPLGPSVARPPQQAQSAITGPVGAVINSTPIPKAAAPIRFKTSSPGIGKDGRRISYGK